MQIQEWCDKNVKRSLNQCTSTNDLETEHKNLIKQLTSEIDKERNEKVAELEKFFQNDDHKGILIQWKEEKFQSFELAVKTLRNTTTKSIKDITEISKCDLQHRQRLGQHEQEIFQKAAKLADEFKEKSVDDGTLDIAFNQMWEEWIGGFTSENSGSGHDIPSTTEQMIYESFPESKPVLKDEIQRTPLEEARGKHKPLSNIYDFDIKKEDIIVKDHSKVRRFFRGFKMLVGVERKSEQWKMTQHLVANLIGPTLNTIVEYLDGLIKTDQPFHPHFVSAILKTLKQGIKSVRSDPNQREVIIRLRFEATLAVHIFHYAIPVFEKMQKEYDDRHSLAAKMKKYKEATKSLFKNKVKQCTDEVIFADLLCDNIKRLVTNAVRIQLATAVARYVVSHFGSKHNLIKAMLGKLARTAISKELSHTLQMQNTLLEDG